MLTIQHVSKSFKYQQVMEDINLTVSPGELIHIVGGNGCGKSTLFKMICGILEQDSGTIMLEDGVVLGALIENPAFMEQSSMKENLKFLANINHNYDEAHISSLAHRFGLEWKNRTRMKKYSVGMRQKVGIIQAIMENQNLILLDEPTRGLDAQSLEIFRNIVEELIQEGKSIVIASHDNLSELQFTKKYLMQDGKLQEVSV